MSRKNRGPEGRELRLPGENVLPGESSCARGLERVTTDWFLSRVTDTGVVHRSYREVPEMGERETRSVSLE